MMWVAPKRLFGNASCYQQCSGPCSCSLHRCTTLPGFEGFSWHSSRSTIHPLLPFAGSWCPVFAYHLALLFLSASCWFLSPSCWQCVLQMGLLSDGGAAAADRQLGWLPQHVHQIVCHWQGIQHIKAASEVTLLSSLSIRAAWGAQLCCPAISRPAVVAQARTALFSLILCFCLVSSSVTLFVIPCRDLQRLQHGLCC